VRRTGHVYDGFRDSRVLLSPALNSGQKICQCRKRRVFNMLDRNDILRVVNFTDVSVGTFTIFSFPRGRWRTGE